MKTMSRRAFVRVGLAAGGGLLVGACAGGDRESGAEAEAGGAGARPSPPPGADPAGLNAFVELSREGVVTVIVPTPEIGQGVRTSLAMILAEEMGADWSAVRVRQAEAAGRYGSQTVGGSDSVRDYWEPLRRAGATARELLKEAASQRWGVPAEECRAEAGRVLHPGSGRTIAFGELANEAARIPLSRDVALKAPADFQLVGRGAPGVDVVEIVRGEALYGLDVRVPGLLRAVVARSPLRGGRPDGFDAAAALAVPGVRGVFEVEAAVPAGDLYGAVRSGVAVVADDTWSAMRGREALDVRWSSGEDAEEQDAAIRARLLGAARGEPGYVLREEGSPAAEFARARRIVEAEYELPALAHLCMEPMNFTASVRADGCDAWGPTQTPRGLQQAIATQLRLPASGVRVHPTLAGGGFGRRLAYDYGVEAALVSRAAGAPVQVVWTREDDVRHDYYRPPSTHRLRAALGDDGTVTAWEHRIATASLLANIVEGGGSGHPGLYDVQGAADFPLAVAHVRVGYTPVPVGLQMGSWRSVAHSFNTFAAGSFVDEIAAALGADPFETLRQLMGDARVVDISLPLSGRRGRPRVDVGRLLRVLEIAADRSEWHRPHPEGWGRGIACVEYKGSYAAHVAEVSAESGGRFRVRRIVAVLDCGRVVNPTGARAQVEGAAMDGVATVLHWGVSVDHGMVVQSNFHDHPTLRMSEAPAVEVHLVDSAEPPAGAGEPPYPSVAPAIANAVFRATGRRLRRLPA